MNVTCFLKQGWLLNSNRGCFAWLTGKVFPDSLETGPMETSHADKTVVRATYQKPDFTGSVRKQARRVWCWLVVEKVKRMLFGAKCVEISKSRRRHPEFPAQSCVQFIDCFDVYRKGL
jgi:hypothetical protein